jgi:hypothetical protein
MPVSAWLRAGYCHPVTLEIPPHRNRVTADGTKPAQCGSAQADQIFGAPEGEDHLGNNGMVVCEANGVHLRNFSTCNLLGDNAGSDSIWFDGGGSRDWEAGWGAT